VARFYPNALRAGVPVSEQRVFNGLKKLGDDWVVMHGLQFVAPGHGRHPPRNGEADFILAHQSQGLIVLEVKGGHYEVEHGRWFTFPDSKRTPMDRSPFAQAMGNRYDLRDYVVDRTGLRGIPFGHAVVFTDGAPDGNLGPEAPSAIIVNGTEVADLRAAVRRICAHWFTAARKGMPADRFDLVLSALVPSGAVVAGDRYSVDVALVDVRQLTERQIQFTTEQLEVVEATAPGKSVCVLGAAGTGKTIIASRRAAQLAGSGMRVVFIADQRYLHGSLLKQPSLRHPNIILGTPAEVIRKLTGRDPPPALWEGFLEAADGGPVVDTVIIDEAQSYDDDLLEAICTLRPSSCQLYGDPYQRDSTGMWRPPGSPETFWLTQNCRNSLPIAKLTARLSGSLAPHAGASGPPVRFLEAERERKAFSAQFAATVKSMLAALEPAELATLTCARDTAELRKILASCHVRVARWPGDPGVTLLSAREFRGCEAPAVLLVTGPGHECGAADSATNHYVAVSRAVAELMVLGNAEDWNNYRFLMETL
jgi:hypothetical protein